MLHREVHGGYPVEIDRRVWHDYAADGAFLPPVEVRGQLAVATTTLYRDPAGGETDKVRSRLAAATVQAYRAAGHKVVVVDGGSPDSFLGQLRELGAIIEHEREPGMGKGRRQAFRLAYETGRPYILWTEPEKQPLAEDTRLMATPLALQEAACIVPFRSWEAMETYPPAQRFSELTGNLIYSGQIGYYLDVFFGPKIWRRELTDYYLGQFERLKAQLDLPDLWDSTIIPVVHLVRDGLSVGDVNSGYRHPPEQTAIESGDADFDRKRTFQLDSLAGSLCKVMRHFGSRAS